MVSADTIIELAVCSCGHEIARHDARGCPGARATFCMCTLTPSAALDDAIERIHRSNSTGRATMNGMRGHSSVRTTARSARF
jgi:hypothetical protein